jgi:hypothetical protein
VGIHLSGRTEVTEVQIVYRAAAPGCGVRIFSHRLGTLLADRGWSIEYCNVRTGDPGTSAPLTIVHYVPSMWARDDGALVQCLEQRKNGCIVTILHGMYGPRESQYRAETACPELPLHVQALALYSQVIVALSHSCADAWGLWATGGRGVRLLTRCHPGAPQGFQTITPSEAYVFLGGVIRQKKDILGESLQGLVSDYARRAINVWVHLSNRPACEFRQRVWRVTSGLLSDEEWFCALAGATSVLCPYETRIQTVSGVISEAISLGTRVLSTSFAFAREMRVRYPALVELEDDLSRWGGLPLAVKPGERPVGIPSWEEFADSIADVLGNPGAPPNTSLRRTRCARR